MKSFKSLATLARTAALGTAMFAGVLAVPATSQAQTATILGNLGGFDVVNDSGVDAHGFEIQIEGAQSTDIAYLGFGQRYGQATVTPYDTGVYVRWVSRWDDVNQKYVSTTPQYVPGPISWNDCYSAGSRYASSGCEHFGVSLKVSSAPLTFTYRWLVASADTPGAVTALDRPSAIVAPIGSIVPPVAIATPPVVVVKVEAPEPPEAPEVFGDAQWIRIFKTELTRHVSLDELTSDNITVVPEDPTQVEISWDIIQADPPSTGGGNGNGNGRQTRARKQNQGAILSAATRSIVRRYELYKFTGTYDPITHEATCGDGNLCAAPSAGELGDFISAQNSAVNIVPDVVSVNLAGPGNVSDSTGQMNCGNKCDAFAPAGSQVTLFANAGNGAAFHPGWGAPCDQATNTACVLTVNGAMSVNASFAALLKVTASNPGTSGSLALTSLTGGVLNGAIACGAGAVTCAAQATAGSTMTFVAKAAAGFVFSSWTGSCTGTTTTCVITASKDVSVGAKFSAVSTGGGGGGGGGSTSSSFTLQLGRSNPGTISGTPAGTDRALDCGSNCSAKFAPGTIVTLTATPQAGKTFVGWSGDCAGTAVTCTLTVDRNKSVLATFAK